ncbi:MAG: addiction module protein [Sulfuricella sp.]|nr:addiction module protein [Sulfuricella sp.]
MDRDREAHRRLPVQERIRLVELVWDSVAAVPEAVEISPALKAELEARLAEFEANPDAGYSWDQAKSRLNLYFANRTRPRWSFVPYANFAYP